MAKKKNNNLWYILGGVVIAILIITIIVMQVQNSERQKELQRQQESLEWEMKQKECTTKCESSWMKMHDGMNCVEYEQWLKENSNYWSSSRNPEDFNCDRSYPNDNGGCDCECSCITTDTFTIN